MSKKRKKTKQEQIAKKKSNIQVVTCIECLRDGSTLTQEECNACDLHNKGYCNYTKPKQMINTIGFGTPMRYNRNFFQMSSDSLREASLNYYIATDVMNEVRSIKGYPRYRKLKMQLLSGEFKQDEEPEQPTVLKAEVIKPVHFLIEGKGGFNEWVNSVTDPDRESKLSNCSPAMYDLLVNGKTFYLTQWEGGYISGEWEVLYYLYKVYELNGFGDIDIDGQPYRILFHESPGTKADMIVAQREDRIIIGKVVKHVQKAIS